MWTPKGPAAREPSMSLPSYDPTRRSELILFDLSAGVPAALGVLRRHLGPVKLLRVLARYSALSLRDPLAELPTEGWPAEREVLVRHQLRAAVLLDEALIQALDLDEARRCELLLEVISETGARFIQKILPLPEVSDWHEASHEERERFLGEATGRFFNSEIDEVYIDDDELGFDVCDCRFVTLTEALGRPYLAAMFCAADSVFFERPEAPVRLERTGTLATGASRCDFRFSYRDGGAS